MLQAQLQQPYFSNHIFENKFQNMDIIIDYPKIFRLPMSANQYLKIKQCTNLQTSFNLVETIFFKKKYNT